MDGKHLTLQSGVGIHCFRKFRNFRNFEIWKFPPPRPPRELISKFQPPPPREFFENFETFEIFENSEFQPRTLTLLLCIPNMKPIGGKMLCCIPVGMHLLLGAKDLLMRQAGWNSLLRMQKKTTRTTAKHPSLPWR